MRALRNLLILLVVIVVLGAALDVGLRLLLQSRVEAAIEAPTARSTWAMSTPRSARSRSCRGSASVAR